MAGALPQNTAKFTEALKQHGQIAVLHIATGTQAHILASSLSLPIRWLSLCGRCRWRKYPASGRYRQRSWNPQNTAKFTEALKQHGQIAVLHIATGTQAHIFQLRYRSPSGG
jgi:protein-L-isoaspartate O-methyltransferase